MFEKYTIEQLKVLYSFFGIQNKSDTRYIIDKYNSQLKVEDIDTNIGLLVEDIGMELEERLGTDKFLNFIVSLI